MRDYALNAANAELRKRLDDNRYLFRFVSDGGVVFDGTKHKFGAKCKHAAKILILEHACSGEEKVGANIATLEDGTQVVDFIVAKGSALEDIIVQLCTVGRSFESAHEKAKTDAGLKPVVEALDEVVAFLEIHTKRQTLLIRCAEASKRLLGQGDSPLLGAEIAFSYIERFDSVESGMSAIRTMLSKHGLRLDSLENEMAKAQEQLAEEARKAERMRRRLSDELRKTADLRERQDKLELRQSDLEGLAGKAATAADGARHDTMALHERQEELEKRQDEVEVLAGEAATAAGNAADAADDARHDAIAADEKAEEALNAIVELEVRSTSNATPARDARIPSAHSQLLTRQARSPTMCDAGVGGSSLRREQGRGGNCTDAREAGT